MRDRLIELFGEIENSTDLFLYTDMYFSDEDKEILADHLLANGVLVPPCKVGDDIWWVNSETNTVECQKQGIKAVCWDGEKWYIRDSDNSVDPIGTKWTCLTKEDAESFLKGGDE